MHENITVGPSNPSLPLEHIIDLTAEFPSSANNSKPAVKMLMRDAEIKRQVELSDAIIRQMTLRESKNSTFQIASSIALVIIFGAGVLAILKIRTLLRGAGNMPIATPGSRTIYPPLDEVELQQLKEVGTAPNKPQRGPNRPFRWSISGIPLNGS
ncbi:unnamed protein product [Rotaria magnacalcarata]|uniref:Uncharacterized protein n=1 Tax=Rotaria magnacalcarata TaxID=392030 RepID=A0A820CGC7_9BILA|nr:unnamed protein product [Rotaria magnacalcarata]CAF4213275.1 unnamed protein product [Rotaria magnacalcarata]